MDGKVKAGLLIGGLGALTALAGRDRAGGQWDLVSAEERAGANPATFKIPSRARRRSLRPGDQVKLLFRETHPDAVVERMWVVVTEVSPSGTVEGTLANQPAVTPGLRHGDLVKFGPEHVASIAR